MSDEEAVSGDAAAGRAIMALIPRLSLGQPATNTTPTQQQQHDTNDPESTVAEEPDVRRRTKRRNFRTVLTRMDENFVGPFSVLTRSVKEQNKIKVWTRSSKFVRGICTGYLVAYDKHCNLAMTDVDEVYKNPAPKPSTKSTRKKRRKKKKTAERQNEANVAESCTVADDDNTTSTERLDTIVQRLDMSNTPDEVADTNSGRDDKVEDTTAKSAQEWPSSISDGAGRRISVPTVRGAEGEDSNSADLDALTQKLDLLQQQLGRLSDEERTNSPDRTVDRQVEPLLQRHVNQLFIRGDNVVMVAIVE